MVLGQSMFRTDDGMRGTVEMVGDVARIAYLDRGEMRFAGKGEKWEPVKPPPRNLRLEEILSIARSADRVLMSMEHNQPFKFWELGKGPVYDQGLIDVIVSYLEKRGG